MIPIEVLVYSHEDPNELLDVLNGRMDPSYLEEIKANGGGDITLSVSDPKLLANPDLLEYRNLIRVKVDGNVIGAFLVGKQNRTTVDSEDAREDVKVSGEGLRAWLKEAGVDPVGGLRPNSSESRSFNFSSPRGDWYDDGQWTATVNVVNWGDVVGSPWRFAPAEWPDAPKAKWVWSSSGYSQAAGDNYFRFEFTSTIAEKYSLFAAADDAYAIYVDGELLTISDPEDVAWSQTNRIDMDLEPGDHVVGIRVSNKTAGSPAALIAALYVFGDPNVPSSAVLLSYTGQTLAEANARVTATTQRENATLATYNSTPAGPNKDAAYAIYLIAKSDREAAQRARNAINAGENWRVAGYPNPAPGWSPGEILNTLLAEAEARGATFPLHLNPTFTNTVDSYGDAWDRSLDWSFELGDSLESVVEKMEELVCDLWIDPETLDLHMAAERGVDRTVFDVANGVTPLVFEDGKNLTQASMDGVGEIVNSLLIKTVDGWIRVQDEDSIAQYGVIESRLDTGLSDALSRAVAEAIFLQKANPERGASYDIVPTPGHVPFVDFNVGDWVLAPNERGLLVKRRVMSISVEEDEAGNPEYSVEFDTIFRDNEDKLNRWLGRMGGGSLGGQFSNAGGGQSTPIGQPTTPAPSAPPTQYPVSPTNLAAESTGLWEVNGVSAYSLLHLTWDPVTSNTDGSAAVPIGYEVWGKLSTESDNVYRRLTTVFTNEATIQPFQTDSEWDFKVRAFNGANAMGSFSDVVTHAMESPNVPMDAPSEPFISSSNGVLILNWDGELNGSPPPPQFRYVYAMVSPAGANTFVRMGPVLQRDGREIFLSGLTVDEDYDAYFVAVDGLGIESAPSATSTGTVVGVDVGDLTELEEAIAAAEDAARRARGMSNMLNDNSFESNTTEFWTLESGDVTNVTTAPRTGVRSLRVDDAGVASKYQLVLEVAPGEQYRLEAWARSVTAPTGATEEAIVLGVEYGSDPFTLGDSADVALSPAMDETYAPLFGVWTVPAGVRWVRPFIRVDDAGNDYFVDDVSLRLMIPSALIVDGAITAPKIGAGEVIAGKLAADSVATGNLQAGSITGAKIQAGEILGLHIAARTIVGDNIEAGTISVVNLEPGIGETLNISGNVSIVSATAAIADVQSGVDGVQGNFEEMRTYYDFGPTGAVISTPDSPFQLKLSADRISMLELGVEVSYWNSGQMFVRSMVGEEVILGNHKIEKYGTGTVVRAL